LEQTTGLKNLLPSGRNQWMVYISCLMVFVGFSCSRFVISLGVIGLIITGPLASDIRQTAATYIRRPAFYINAVFFLVILLSGINSTDKGQWLNFLRIKVPFLILPLAFCGYTFFDRAFSNKLLFAFAFCMFISAICVMVNYGLHYDEINLRILSGSVIPVPFSHIRYTLMLVFSFFSLLWLWEQHIISRRYLLFIPALFFFIVVHVLSSRSAWLALYAGLLFYFFVYIYRSRQYLTGILMLAAIVALPFLLYHLIPSFHNKIGYMRYTADQYKKGHIDDMGDAMRLSSWQVGVEIIRRHPWTGTGVGDLLKESKAVSRELFPGMKNDDDRKMPHNEFIWIWAGCGIFGLLAYCVAFLYPFIASVRYKNWPFGLLAIIFFTSFLTEYPLEEQIGSTFYLVFLLIFLTHFHYHTAAHD
jgi:O-antigen ligase